MGRRRSSAGKRKSVSKLDGITLSELLEQKDGNIDSLLHRITTTSDIKTTNLPTVPDSPDENVKEIEEKVVNHKSEKTCLTTVTETKVLKSPDNIQDSASQRLNPGTLPMFSSSAANPGIASFRDIMASQARKAPAKPPSDASLQTNARGSWSAGPVSPQYSNTTTRTAVSSKHKKMSQKQRKRLEQENDKKATEEAAVPNAWGLTVRYDINLHLF